MMQSDDGSTTADKRAHKKKYNYEYWRRPEVVARTKAKMADPHIKAQRAAYQRQWLARQPRVKREARLARQREVARKNPRHRRAVWKAWYAKDPEKVLARQRGWAKRRQAEWKALVAAIKLENGCAQCGYNACESALHFHHINPSTKRFSIGSLLAGYSKCSAISKETLLSEIAKCVILCANCHYSLHYPPKERKDGRC